MTGEGKRQIMAFHCPGDIPDLQSLHLRVLDRSLGTLTACQVGFIQHEVLRDLCHRYPRINDALWRETLIDASIFREWVMNVGQRDAYSRIAHFIATRALKRLSRACSSKGESARARSSSSKTRPITSC